MDVHSVYLSHYPECSNIILHYITLHYYVILKLALYTVYAQHKTLLFICILQHALYTWYILTYMHPLHTHAHTRTHTHTHTHTHTDWTLGGPIESDIYWLYMAQVGMYLHFIFSTVFVNARKKDYNVLLLHHFLTIALLTWSYAVRWVSLRINTAMLVLYSERVISWFRNCKIHEMRMKFVNRLMFIYNYGASVCVYMHKLVYYNMINFHSKFIGHCLQISLHWCGGGVPAWHWWCDSAVWKDSSLFLWAQWQEVQGSEHACQCPLWRLCHSMVGCAQCAETRSQSFVNKQ